MEARYRLNWVLLNSRGQYFLNDQTWGDDLQSAWVFKRKEENVPRIKTVYGLLANEAIKAAEVIWKGKDEKGRQLTKLTGKVIEL